MQIKVSYLVLAAALATGISAGSAIAGGNKVPCGATPVFAAYGDTLNYIPTSQVIGSTSFTVTSNVRVSSAGGTAVFKPTSCVAKLEPVVRFWAQNVGSPAATLTVSADYKDTSGLPHHLAIATLSGYSTWQPTPILSFEAANVAGNIKISLTANGDGADWVVSDVYFDPRKSH